MIRRFIVLTTLLTAASVSSVGEAQVSVKDYEKAALERVKREQAAAAAARQREQAAAAAARQREQAAAAAARRRQATIPTERVEATETTREYMNYYGRYVRKADELVRSFYSLEGNKVTYFHPDSGNIIEYIDIIPGSERLIKNENYKKNEDRAVFLNTGLLDELEVEYKLNFESGSSTVKRERIPRFVFADEQVDGYNRLSAWTKEWGDVSEKIFILKISRFQNGAVNIEHYPQIFSSLHVRETGRIGGIKLTGKLIEDYDYSLHYLSPDLSIKKSPLLEYLEGDSYLIIEPLNCNLFEDNTNISCLSWMRPQNKGSNLPGARGGTVQSLTAPTSNHIARITDFEKIRRDRVDEQGGGYLGLQFMSQRGLAASTPSAHRRKGAFIWGVRPNQAAAVAGLLPGDIIVAVDGKEVIDDQSLVDILGNMVPDVIMKFDVIRSGLTMKFNVKNSSMLSDALNRGYLGVRVQPMNKEISDSLGLPELQGEFVHSVQPSGAADLAGIRSGDVILKVGEMDVTPTQTLVEIVSSMASGTEIPIELIRQGVRIIVRAKLSDRPGG